MPGRTLTRKLIDAHLVDGEPTPGEEIALRIDQTLTQDATGTLVMQELEALGLDRARTEVSVQYVDHNLLQADERNAEDHAFLRSAAPPLRPVVLQARQRRLAPHPHAALRRPRQDAGRLRLAHLRRRVAGHAGDRRRRPGGRAGHRRASRCTCGCREIWGVRLTGELPDWVSAKDVILEMLRRHGVKGGVQPDHRVPRARAWPASPRWTGTSSPTWAPNSAPPTTVFPADDAVRDVPARRGPRGRLHRARRRPGRGLRRHRRRSTCPRCEPLIARPSSPGNVVPVREVAGEPVGQVVIGSSANPGLRDFAIAAAIVAGRQTNDAVSFDVNPTSREILAGPHPDGRHVRPDRRRGPHPPGRLPGLHRHGPGPRRRAQLAAHLPPQLPRPLRHRRRRGLAVLPGDRRGVRADRRHHRPARPAPRDLDLSLPDARRCPSAPSSTPRCSSRRCRRTRPRAVELVQGPEHLRAARVRRRCPTGSRCRCCSRSATTSPPTRSPRPGRKALPYRSNIPKLAEFTFTRIDPDYPRAGRDSRTQRPRRRRRATTTARAPPANTPRSPRATWACALVIAKSFARIHWQNLANFGVLALEFTDPDDYDQIRPGDVLHLADLPATLPDTRELAVESGDRTIQVRHRLSPRQVETLIAGGRIAQLAQAAS